MLPSVPFAETLEAMDKLYKAGKFKRLCLSNFTSFEVTEVVMTCKYNGWVRPTIYQGIYNCMQRGIETELIPACNRYGLDVVVYSPIAGGLLSGKHDKESRPEEGRFSDKFLKGVLREKYFKNGFFEAINELKEAAAKHGLSTIEVALRWLVHHSKLKIFNEDGSRGGDGIITGVSNLKHLDDNLDYLEKAPSHRICWRCWTRRG
ncbi:NADP-dependent oxidoreductase domain-containing protein [Diplogelasinospora grovesii]|uniref:NADP-dependent oxidoreductase domain-containing protein n=1 Tax=Diplogelasinospora grovesii TaxID=303347 RepID=A0AAN6S177_9PEZI|nr:NADP-dependent oxidoreductase domain-containing protein [Diplogelasinospora grovesii]